MTDEKARIRSLTNDRYRFGGGIAGLLSLLVLSTLLGFGCRSLPAVTPAPAASASTIAVVSAGGRESSRSINAIAAQAGDDAGGPLRTHLRDMAAHGGPPLHSGNQVKLLIDGPATYDAMFSTMAQARDHINLEVYIFQDDSIGRKLAELLVRKQREGVQVSILYDAVGSIATPKSFFDDLRAAGIKVQEFNPVDPLQGDLLDLNNRDHRKIVIVDGRIAYTGGINISSVYAHGSAWMHRRRFTETDASRTTEKQQSGAAAATENTQEGWRDTQIEVRGPAVAEFQQLFIDNWQGQGGAALASSNFFPALAASGDKFVRVIGSSARDENNWIYVDLLAAIQRAHSSVHLTMAYFSPDRATIDALCAAVARGVDVTLVLPGFSDLWLIHEAGRSHYTPLLRAGVRIYERHDALLHAKTAVIDGVWSTVGSANMDMRSFLHNDEVNVVVLGDEFGAQMEKMFADDVAQAQRVTLEDWRERSLWLRVKQSFARIWTYWL